ncbi:hypothetical protein C4546_01765 [Candidatus Parcubacteria bacterium]|nr:MAG: hypothetical protein C4546_01765 [Candidatus Parcubacteria bacterium]
MRFWPPALTRRKGKTLRFEAHLGWAVAAQSASFSSWCSLFEKIRTEFAGGGSRAEETQPPPAAAPF